MWRQRSRSVGKERCERTARREARRHALAKKRKPLGDQFMLAPVGLRREKARRNDNAYEFADAGWESAACAILRVRLETGKEANSSSRMFFEPRMRGIFATAIRKGRTVTLRYVTAWRTFASGSRRNSSLPANAEFAR